jgi:WD40 repeat protein
VPVALKMMFKLGLALVGILFIACAIGSWYAFTLSEENAEEEGFLPVRSVVFSPKGDFLAAGGGRVTRIEGGRWRMGRGDIRVWRAQEWEELLSSKDGFSDAVSSVFFASESVVYCGSLIFLTESRGNPFGGVVIRSWSLSDFAEMKPVQLERFRGHRHHHEAFDQKKGLLAVGTVNTSPAVYHVADGSFAFALPKHVSRGLCFSPDGALLLSCAKESPTLHLHDSSNGQLLTRRDLGPSLAACARFSPDGKYVVVVGRAEFHEDRRVYRPGGTRIHVLEADLKKELVNIAAPYAYLDEEINDFTSPAGMLAACPLAVAPDSQAFAVKGSVTSVILLEITTGKLIRTFEGNAEGVNCVAFSPDGKWLAVGSGGHDGRVQGPGAIRIWDVSTGNLVKELR